MQFRLDHMAQAMEVEQFVFVAVIHFPERGVDAHAGTGKQAMFFRLGRRIRIDGVPAQHVRNDAKAPGGERVIDLLAKIAAERFAAREAGGAEGWEADGFAWKEPLLRQRIAAAPKI